jgi:hypothetical protein
MKKLKIISLTLGVFLGLMLYAKAVPTMRLSADGGATWTNVVDNGPLDINPQVGSIYYLGPVGDWDVSIASGFGAPVIGDPLNPHMDVDTINSSSQAENLIVQMSDTNFVGFPNQTFIATLGVITDGTVTYNSYRDGGNVLFGSTSTYTGGPAGTSPSGTAAPLITEGPFSGGTYTASNAVVVPSGGSPYSLTMETIIVHSGPGQTDTDALLYTLPPPPCNCTVTFNAPNTTNCDGTAIPPASATEDCGSGSSPVNVASTAWVTNGACPQFTITRTNTAVDDCGTAHANIQTITVNCAPDCKSITASVTMALTGVAGYTASVANAGAGATYKWDIHNAFITDGQGTPKITWTAGTDTNQMISICVTITTSSGCVSACCITIPLKAGPSGCSFTPGGWGATPQGGNVGTILYAMFPKLYSKGFVVGGTYTMKFTMASNITVYLPAGTTPGVLKKSYTNPVSPTEAGEFGSQVMALKLNVDASNNGYTKPGLANLKIASGYPLAGYKVSDVLILVNKVLGGTTSALPAGVTVSDLTNLMSGINGNFDNCTSNNGVLVF